MLMNLSSPVFAQPNEIITCTGTLVDIQTRAVGWPLAVIYDASSRRTCMVDRAGAEHDPMKPCHVGETCRISGSYRRVGNTYSIQTITSVDRAD
jgi:hypothetical protein